MLLKELAMAWGVTGDEKDVREIIKREVEPYVDEITYDGLGSVIAKKNSKKEGPVVMIAAHMDEVGIIITGVNEDGTLSFEPSGGIDEKVVTSKTVYIGENKIPGLIRLGDGYENSYIYIGVETKNEAEEIVEVGDYGMFTTEYEDFGDGLVKSKALDDRAGCKVLIEILQGNYDLPIYGVFTIQEEIGDRGSYAASYLINPDIGIVLEGTVCSDTPMVEAYRHGTSIGHGPAISIADKTSYFNVGLSEGICELAEKNGIPYQRRRITGGGNDAGAIHVSGNGAKCLTVSVPCRYIHSPISVASYSDFENTVKLLDLFLKEIENGGML
ncbi:M42 family peptidase [Schnuerera sp. xch1]|uniref:M42 family metallopeptidase n=1 Tax=Schnuerera sp. xch1 TaxID=2874283 RepID=UPI001CBBF0E2|nr:M42 family peptidase [Schnuerera sp. xch1]MBZ2174324.1 M42 family peptidase [Schnuerera sp. xch1]